MCLETGMMGCFNCSFVPIDPPRYESTPVRVCVPSIVLGTPTTPHDPMPCDVIPNGLFTIFDVILDAMVKTDYTSFHIPILPPSFCYDYPHSYSSNGLSMTCMGRLFMSHFYTYWP